MEIGGDSYATEVWQPDGDHSDGRAAADAASAAGTLILAVTGRQPATRGRQLEREAAVVARR